MLTEKILIIKLNGINIYKYSKFKVDCLLIKVLAVQIL